MYFTCKDIAIGSRNLFWNHNLTKKAFWPSRLHFTKNELTAFFTMKSFLKYETILKDSNRHTHKVKEHTIKN